MSRFLYLAELYSRLEWEPILSTAPNNYSRENNIYYFDVTQDETSYWVTTWGGTFDTIENTNIQILLSLYLTEVDTSSALIATEFSFYVDGNYIYMNLPRKPWQYYSSVAEVSEIQNGAFSSGAKNPNNPSDIRYNGLKYKTILSVPSLKSKLPDAINGIVLNTTFNYSFDNNNGEFDDTEEKNYFNTPTVIKKTTIENPAISDFKIIRRGIVESVNISFSTMMVTAADYNRYFTNEVCRYITIDEFPNASESVINKKIPIGYNTLLRVPLIEVDKDTADPPEWIDYISIEPSHVYSVDKVYDSDGNELTFTLSEGIIRATSLDDDGEVIEAETADIDGKQNYTIGDILVELVDEFSFFKYIPENWDTSETDYYKTISPLIGFYFEGGSLKDAINDVIKNDMAFLITKNNGLLTIRRWAEEYDSHRIESWQFTKLPVKEFNDAAKYYISTAVIDYRKNINQNRTYYATHKNDSEELSIFNQYRKSSTGNFETDIINESDAVDLSSRLLNRFGSMKEDIKVSTGYDTSEINLLDKVELGFIINGREFTPGYTWIVKEVNPSQDELTLEKYFDDTYILTYDDDCATVDNDLLVIEENL